MRKRQVDERKLKKYEQAEIMLMDIENFDDALSHVYFASDDEKENSDYLAMVLRDRERGKQYAIYVVENFENGSYRLIYGQKRLYAAVKCDYISIMANIIPEDLKLDWDAVNQLYLSDYASRTSYEKGMLFAKILAESGKKFEQLALETGLPYHTLRSLDNAYKTAQKYPSLGEAYREEKVHQGIVNLAANLYKQLGQEDQNVLTEYLIQTKDDGVDRVKKAVKAREDIPVRDRIIGYIQTDLQAVAEGGERPAPDYYVDTENVQNPLLPGDSEGENSFTYMYGFNKQGIDLFRGVYRKAVLQKEAEARIYRTKAKKISKQVLKIFYLMCRDQLIFIEEANLLTLDRLWTDDLLPKSAGKYFSNFEKSYVCYKNLKKAYPMLFTMDFIIVVPIQKPDEYNEQFSVRAGDDISFYHWLISMIRRSSYGTPEENIPEMASLYCEDPERKIMMKNMFDMIRRYDKAKADLKNEIIGILNII